MKTIQTSVTVLGLSLVLFVLGTVGVKGQALSSTQFAGTFSLPAVAQWGNVALPAGDYTLQFGTQETGHRIVVVRGSTNGSPSGVIVAGPLGEPSAKQNAIVCIRDGSTLRVRALDMPAIGESVNFALPRGAKLAAHNGKHGGYAQLAEAPMLIERIPVTLNAK